MRTPPRSHVGAYLLSREAERKRAQLHREAKETRSEQYTLFYHIEGQCFRYCETQEELDLEQERLYINWFRQLLIEELKRPRNLKRVRQPAPSLQAPQPAIIEIPRNEDKSVLYRYEASTLIKAPRCLLASTAYIRTIKAFRLLLGLPECTPLLQQERAESNPS